MARWFTWLTGFTWPTGPPRALTHGSPDLYARSHISWYERTREQPQLECRS